jgi:hypothetical protein
MNRHATTTTTRHTSLRTGSDFTLISLATRIALPGPSWITNHASAHNLSYVHGRNRMKLRFRRRKPYNWKAAYDTLWRDHLARCGCHDSWDQCPCLNRGHKWDGPTQMVAKCGNMCCRWCSPGERLAVEGET